MQVKFTFTFTFTATIVSLLLVSALAGLGLVSQLFCHFSAPVHLYQAAGNHVRIHARKAGITA